ncbi:hypothetical protein PHLCEN_2v12256 [Hermanssonia centrifuga]|uniref:Uncharacterized protein n=1 Tax=Hermanssonia centrifuga TaxID=98765 RepID=A0A2R6NHV5_9APHY|nr:hypothetical protein PHLCEN_2v12256 [Hermanssonia centrifuga]
MLRAKQAKLEARLLELESGLSESSSGGTPVALSPESSSSGSQSEMNAFYPSNDLPLDSSSSAVFGLDWDESTFSVGPGSADSPYQVASSSLAPSEEWLSECPELFLEDVYVGKGKGIAGLANPQMGVSPFSNWWEDQDTFCRNKQKLSVSSI